jgi:hypothetical protein
MMQFIRLTGATILALNIVVAEDSFQIPCSSFCPSSSTSSEVLMQIAIPFLYYQKT